MLHIYTGDGKGKTTAALGLIVRAAGAEMKCAYYSFLKPDSSSEFKLLKQIDNVTLFEMPKKVSWNMEKAEKEKLKLLYNNVLDKILRDSFTLVVLDEALDAISSDLISEDTILRLCKKCEVVLTGRGSCEKLYRAADYITVMKKERHPYDKCEKARKGIEY